MHPNLALPASGGLSRRPRLRRRLSLALVFGGLLAVVAGLSAVTAADPFIAGQPAARPAALPDGGRAAVGASRRLLAALGIPAPADAAAERQLDRLEAATFDDVTFRDGRGRPTLLVRLRDDGSLRHLARLDAPDPAARPMPEAGVPARASTVARAAGLRAAGTPTVAADASSGWAVAWPRVEDGVPVLGDGTWVRLDPDGSVRSVASTASALAPRPPVTVAEADARRIAERELDRLIDPAARTDVHVAGARLAWVAPNDTFEPARPDAPEPVRRLAWVVRAVASGAAADGLRGLELDIDAGTGRLLGGDILE
jgi:hypothetical protein